MTPFWLALQFLTRLPVPATASLPDVDLGRSVPFYPLVGLLIGLLLTVSAWVMGAVDPVLKGALVIGLWVLVTGALHLDGLADCADAWVGGHGDRDRTLAIMKDPAAGPVAVVTLVVVLLVKYAALTVLLRAHFYQVVLLVPMLGRAAIPALMLTTPYVRPGGLGEAMHSYLPRRCTWGMVALTLLSAGVFLGWWATAAGVLCVWLLRELMMRRLGGATGDTYGATVELVEVVLLVASCPLAA